MVGGVITCCVKSKKCQIMFPSFIGVPQNFVGIRYWRECGVRILLVRKRGKTVRMVLFRQFMEGVLDLTSSSPLGNTKYWVRVQWFKVRLSQLLRYIFVIILKMVSTGSTKSEPTSRLACDSRLWSFAGETLIFPKSPLLLAWGELVCRGERLVNGDFLRLGGETSWFGEPLFFGGALY